MREPVLHPEVSAEIQVGTMHLTIVAMLYMMHRIVDSFH